MKRMLQRRGLPMMTRRMFNILRRLRTADEGDAPFITLDDVHKRTINSLVARDWIVASKKAFGEVRYRITGRGLKALKVYEVPSEKRSDGLCPRCGVNERRVYDTGRLSAYCEDCENHHNRRQYAMKGHQYVPGRLCPDCGERPRHECSTGFIKPYCHECGIRRAKEERRRKHDRLLERIQAGEFIPCCRCKKKPRYHTQRQVYDYCHECYRRQQKNARIRRKARKISDLMKVEA